MDNKRTPIKLMKDVAVSGYKAADALNKAASKAADAVNKLGKQLNKAKHSKAVVSASEMETNILYKGLCDDKLYRRSNDKSIEKMVNGKWTKAKVDYNFLTNEKFREY